MPSVGVALIGARQNHQEWATAEAGGNNALRAERTHCPPAVSHDTAHFGRSSPDVVLGSIRHSLGVLYREPIVIRSQSEPFEGGFHNMFKKQVLLSLSTILATAQCLAADNTSQAGSSVSPQRRCEELTIRPTRKSICAPAATGVTGH
jgi:hypothetical protein